MTNHIKKILLEQMPFPSPASSAIFSCGHWPARWIRPAACPARAVFLCRNSFRLDRPQTVRCHVSADSVYAIELDGECFGQGPEQGDLRHYCFDSYELELAAGYHVLTARIFRPADRDAVSRMNISPGFLFAAEGALSAMLDSGRENWQVALLDGIHFGNQSWMVPSPVETDWRIYRPEPEAWSEPEEAGCGLDASVCMEFREYERLLTPSTLPEQKSDPIRGTEAVYVSASDHPVCLPESALDTERADWQALLDGHPIAIPAHHTRNVLFRFDDYYCGNAEIVTSGGRDAALEAAWAEALLRTGDAAGRKGDRAAFSRLEFEPGQYDRMICGGGENESLVTVPCSYRAGRFFRLLIHTGAEALTIHALAFREMRFPIEMEGCFRCSDNRLNAVVAPAVRSLQMCMHDTYIDCPYYEQLMYLGDTRLQLLANYLISPERRLADKAVRLMAAGRMDGAGMLQSRYPSARTQRIPTFSMIFTGTVRDYILYRDWPEITAQLLLLARSVIDSFEPYRTADGLLNLPHGWNFVDWIPRWYDQRRNKWGEPPDAMNGVSGVLNAMLLYAISMTAEAHELVGDPSYAAHYRARGKKLADRFVEVFFRPERGLFSDRSVQDEFSEHTQLMALLSGFLDPGVERETAAALFECRSDVAEATVSFSFYFLEACAKFHRMDRFMSRMQLWFDMAELNLMTLLESPEPSRSDCHGWGAHVLFHFYSSLLGIRPQRRGFADLRIAPQPAGLTSIEARLPHPAGWLEIRYDQPGDDWRIVLPDGIAAVFEWQGRTVPLHPGENRLRPEAMLSVTPKKKDE